MILAAGRINVEKLLSGDVAGQEFTQIAFGTSGTPVADGDTAITAPSLIKNITSVDYLTGSILQINTLIESSDPAIVIQEIGLLNADGILCYRKVVPPVNKVFGTSYAVSYKIKVQ